MLNQIGAVTLLNLRSIPQRAGLSLATIISIALVTGVLLGFLAMSNGFRATLQGTGSESVAVMLRAGSQAELNSGLSSDQVRLIEEAPGIARDADGTALVSGELFVIADGIKRSSQTEANLPLRGVGEQALRLREGFELVEGRMFETGTNELVVGEAVLREFSGFELGETIRLGPNEWVVVGIFSTGGSVFDSEIWADIAVIQNLYNRGTGVQSIRARLTSPEAIEELRAYEENEPRLNLDIQSETDFFSGQAGGTAVLIEFIGWPLAIVMAIGALAGAWNTMYSSVDTRMREIATLRAIGFSGFAAAVGTMVESLVLAAIGGLVGAGAVYLLFNGISASTLGSGFTQVVFSFAVTGGSVIAGMVMAIIIGFLGGLVPAIRSAYVPLLTVHRSE
ncbi:peptide ABC transporter permease [Maricaulis sp. W15]|uniref:Putative ABC transport system permease protein n=1 Tax=Maricaulis maris TaxID=74318 RepID=A0A495D0X6_9PROT|nr:MULTISPECIES: ABC transporter permease [Maricaulis]OLF72388.1 peptide ABC transporter permease [Maricaulis sp. W15]RKQ95136.1 putative ABC transport system permease protein [Maricaulis maris]